MGQHYLMVDKAGEKEMEGMGLAGFKVLVCYASGRKAAAPPIVHGKDRSTAFPQGVVIVEDGLVSKMGGCTSSGTG